MARETSVAVDQVSGKRGQRVAARLLPMLFTVTEVAEALGLSRSKVYELIAARELDAYRPGGRLRVPADSIAKLLERSRV